MPYSLEIFGSSVILVGSFNPAIFSTDWLERNNLIGSGDAEVARAATNMVVSRQATALETEWFQLQVLENQFSLTSKGALSLAFKDLAEGVLTLVPVTPVSAIGLNFHAHFKMASESDYHKVGDTLVPKDIWEEVFAPLTPGTADLTVKLQRAKRGEIETNPDEIRIHVQPSGRVKLGVYLMFNDHRASFSSDPKHANAQRAAEIISSDWEDSWRRAEAVFDQLLQKVLA